MTNVISLRGEPVANGEPVPDVVAELEEWLERARSGDVIGVAVTANFMDGASGSRWAGCLSRSMVGQCFSLMQRISTALDQ